MTQEIKLPPLPEPEVNGTKQHPTLKICYTAPANYTPEQMDSYARAAVEADRASRTAPSDADLFAIHNEHFPPMLAGSEQYLAFAKDLLSRYGQPAAPAALGFRIEDRGGMRILVYRNDSWCPATDGECALWDALMSSQPAASAEPVAQTPAAADAAFNHWYETKFKPAMERGPFDKYVARQAWFAAIKTAAPVAAQAQPVVNQQLTTAEHDHAIKEGKRNAACDNYFANRGHLDYVKTSGTFDAGFDRGWDAALAQQPGSQAIRDAALEEAAQESTLARAWDGGDPDIGDIQRVIRALKSQPAAGAAARAAKGVDHG